jgi:hypothetical protein
VTGDATLDTANQLCHIILNSDTKRAARISTERYIHMYPHDRSSWPHFRRRWYAATRLLGLWVRIPPEVWMSVSRDSCLSCRYRSLRRADLSSRGVLTSVYASLNVIRSNNKPPHLEWVERGQRKKVLIWRCHSHIQCKSFNALMPTGGTSLAKTVLKLIHTYHAVSMPRPCHSPAMPCR